MNFFLKSVKTDKNSYNDKHTKTNKKEKYKSISDILSTVSGFTVHHYI